MEEALSPRQFAEVIGVSESSVKRWVDDGEIAAARTAGGHRRIPRRAAVAFVRRRGLPVVRPDLLGLPGLDRVDASSEDAEQLADALFAALAAGDAATAAGLVHAPYLAAKPLAWIFDDVMAPAMHAVGELWIENREHGVFVEHRATVLCLQAVRGLGDVIDAPSASAPVAVGGAPTGDPYLLPTAMVACVLGDAGLRATDLGPQTPPEVLARAADETQADVVWLSVSTAAGARAAGESVDRVAAGVASRGGSMIIGGREAEPLQSTEGAVMLAGMTDLAAWVSREFPAASAQ